MCHAFLLYHKFSTATFHHKLLCSEQGSRDFQELSLIEILSQGLFWTSTSLVWGLTSCIFLQTLRDTMALNGSSCLINVSKQMCSNDEILDKMHRHAQIFCTPPPLPLPFAIHTLAEGDTQFSPKTNSKLSPC